MDNEWPVMPQSNFPSTYTQDCTVQHRKATNRSELLKSCTTTTAYWTTRLYKSYGLLHDSYFDKSNLFKFVLNIAGSFLGITFHFCELSLCLSSQFTCLTLSPTSEIICLFYVSTHIDDVRVR
jgi:hypothetical protein